MKSDDLPSADDAFGESAPGVEWQDYYHAIRKRLWIVILCLILGAAGSMAFLTTQQRAYQARAVIYIKQEQSHVLDKLDQVHEERIVNLDMINTVVDLLKSFSFSERVASRLKLQKDPHFLMGLTNKPAADLTSEDAAGLLKPNVTASYRPKTRLIDIFVTHPDPAMATQLANAYADEYLRYGLELRLNMNKAASQYLFDEAEGLRKKVELSEQAMQNFRKEELRSVSLENAQQSMEQKLTEYSRSLSELESKTYQLDSDLKTASATPSDIEALLRLPSISQQPRVAEINQAITEADRAFAILKQRYRAKHPTYIALQTQLSSLQANRAQVLHDVVALLKGERARLQTQYDGTKAAKEEQETKLLTVTQQTLKYNELKRDLENNRALYNQVQARISEIDVSKGMTESQVQIHEHALGAASVSANPLKVYSIGPLLGLLAGVAIALGLHMLDHSVKTVDQAEHLSGLAVLAAVPKKGKPDPRSLDVVADREGIVAESFRSLRTSLAMTTRVEERRVFLFTSAIPSEGKTFCSSNFSATLGQQGFRTLLIDADLRRPMASRVFFGEQRQPGLSDLLSGQADFSSTVYPSKIENLDVMPAGSRAPNPAELLAAPYMREILQEALLHYHRVVIDSPPILAVSDSLLIAPLVDATCLVLRSFKTPRKTFLRSLKSLEEVRCRPAGIVFNFLPSGARNYYYYSGKYHGVYGEKGVYGT